MRLQGKTAIVTGAAHGIGRAIALRYAREGARVVAADINEEGARETAAAIAAAGGQALPMRTDVARGDEVARMVDACVAAYGRLDILVNNAGAGQATPIAEIEEEAFDRLIGCNLRGYWLGCHYAVPHLRQAGGGVILGISSVQGLGGWPRTSIYAAAKAGILGATRALAVELASDQIRVNAICPGAIRTYTPEERVAIRLGPEYVAEFRRRFGAQLALGRGFAQPLPRHGQPEDIADCALFLASDEASFITGTYIVVDGGMTAATYEPDAETSPGHAAWKEMRQWILSEEQRRRQG